MSIIVTNEITVPAERAAAVAAKFAQNAEGIVGRDGFEGFELCRPTDPADDRWLVVTRWRDEAAYEAWRTSRQFERAHTPRHETAKGEGAAVRHYDVALSVTG